MRVTNKLITDAVTNNLFRNTERLLELEKMISSGKRVNKPSDDPIGMAKILDYRKTLASIDQYSKNIAHGKSWLGLTDTTLDSINTLLIQAKEVAESQATETATEETRQIAAGEIENIYEQIVQLANTKLGNSYIFAGHKTGTSPFYEDTESYATYHGDDGEIRIITGEDVDMQINIPGDEVFQNSDVDIFEMLNQLKTALENNNTEGISDQIEPLDDALDQILNARGKVGARLNRLETTEKYWSDFSLRITEMLSDMEDIDLAQAMTQLVSQQTAYQASLETASMIIQPSLINFLR
jgi:flagellar hook-associated protein 3 FlgL